MPHSLASPAFAILTACRLLAQNAPLEFDVASVKPNQTDSGHTSIDRNGGVLRMTNVTLKACISLAYGLTEAQVSGPGWLDSEEYDIVAKAPSGAGENQQPAMLRALLADRFKLALHRDTKEIPIYALVVAKNGAKILSLIHIWTAWRHWRVRGARSASCRFAESITRSARIGNTWCAT